MKSNRNYFYGIGTLGRDMVYALTSMYLMYYLTDVLKISVDGIAFITIVMVVLRIFDALNDPFCGMLIDNTATKYGKFKPWLILGGLASSVTTILLFMDFGLEESAFLWVFTIIYLFWGMTYTAHDIAYWSMLPSLTNDQHQREKIGSIAKICADIGIFTVVIGIVPISELLAQHFGTMKQAYFIIAIILAVLMFIFMTLMTMIVKENRIVEKQNPTQLKEIITIITKNDQLLWVVIAMVLFTIANTTTTSLGIYYFEYIFGDKEMYSIFALILAISQLLALMTFPMLSKKIGRAKCYALGTLFVVIGYITFFLGNDLIMIAIGGTFIFFGEGFIQILILMFISDCVDYGHWKLGRRNDSIMLSLQPFIAKMGSAISAGIVGLTVILSHLNLASGPQDLSQQDVFIFKMAMMGIPLIVIVISFLVYKKKYIIDETLYAQIQKELHLH